MKIINMKSKHSVSDESDRRLISAVQMLTNPRFRSDSRDIFIKSRKNRPLHEKFEANKK